MTVAEALNLIKSDIENVEKALVSNIDTKIPLINEVVSYLLESGGKRLRPAFLILSSKMCGYNGINSTMLSVVIEYIHTATLLHDDVIDGAKYRRKKRSANGIYGNDIAVLCGDFMYSRGYITLTEYGNKEIQKLLSATAMKMSEGEIIQLLKTADTSITIDDYLQIIERKTAVLFSAACEIGGRLANLDEDKCLSLSNFGRDLGIAFQMSDDILDYLGDPAITGKDNGTDLFEGKLTLPAILLLDKVDSEEKSKISDIFTNDARNKDDLMYIIKLMNKYNIKEKSEEVMLQHINRAVSNLDNFPSSQYKDAIISLSKSMIHRQN